VALSKDVHPSPHISAPNGGFLAGASMVKKRYADLLSARTLMRLPTGLYADGRGLYLLVTSGGSRRWVFRTKVKGGRRRELGLGNLRDVSLNEARAKASDLRLAARAGRDPVLERRAREASAVTFRQAFDSYFELKARSIGNAKHLAQWRSTMEAYVFPVIGGRPVADITSGEVIAILEPIWHAKAETAKRVLQRIRAVIDAAILRNWRDRASPCIGVVQALGGTAHRLVQHHRAMPYDQVPAFLSVLRACDARPETKLALEWLVLTATRSSETRGAQWCEINPIHSTWTIPGHRMKGARGRRTDHVVPLPERCCEILSEVRALNSQSNLLFPSTRTGKTLSDMTFTKLLRTLGVADQATAHGFRSSFRDWASELEKVREVVAEAALGHSVGNKTEAAYRRVTYIEERRALMARWGEYTSDRCAAPIEALTEFRQFTEGPSNNASPLNLTSPSPASHAPARSIFTRGVNSTTSR